MSRPARLTLAIAMGTLPALAAAADFSFDQALFFNAANQNPFQAGAAVSWNKTLDVAVPIRRTEVPAFRFPAAGPLYLEAGGRTEGILGIELAAQFSSGRLDLAYPMRSTITAPTADSVKLGDSFRLSLSGRAPKGGVFDIGSVLDATAAISVGDIRINAGGGGIGLVQPFIRTTFPQLAAQLNLSYEQRNSAYLQGCADAVVTTLCKDIGTLSLPSIGPVKQTIASVDPAGARILPGTPLEAGVDFGKPIPVFGPYGTLTPSYPTLATLGRMASDNGPLRSSASQPILELDVRLDKLLDDFVLKPALLPPLSGPLGPAQYTLLEATGSVFATVYQKFDYQPLLSVRLDFDQPMRLASGSDAFYSITTAAGTALDLRPVNLFRDKVTVRPTYLLGGTLTSETGLGFGAGIDLKALRIQLGSLDSGFAFQDGVRDDIPVLPLYESSFTPVVPGIQGQAFVLDFQSRYARLDIDPSGFVGNGGAEAARIAIETTDGGTVTFGKTGRFYTSDGRRVTFFGEAGAVSYSEDVRFVEYEENGLPVYFVADTDFLDPANGNASLGRIFCVAHCDQVLPTMPESTLLTLADGSTVYANPAATAMALLDPSALPPSVLDRTAFSAGGFTAFAPGEVPPQFQWLQTPAVPEPSAAWLMLAGLGVFAAGRRRRQAAA